ncbi:MAG TPA: folate-binding protein [Xanthobacteraceae bacterium]|jgi:tRNA-modifying protein YgfZ
MRAAVLPERAVIRITGEDATHFLQGLVTSDVGALKAGDARFAALLTPQGKILFDFLVVAVAEDEGGGFVLDAPRALEGALAERLGFYKLRAKVEIARRPDLAVAAILDGSPPADLGLAYPDPRHAGLGTRIVLLAEGAAAAFRDAGFSLGESGEWQKKRIALGVPEGGQDFTYGDTFPHEADMDQLGGVDFQKGCFVGQEVVSRMEHRGSARTRIVPIAYEHASPLPGVEVKIGEKAAGFLGSTANGRGLAKVRLDRIEEGLAANEKLSAGNVPITLVKPDWAKFPFPGERAKS